MPGKWPSPSRMSCWSSKGNSSHGMSSAMLWVREALQVGEQRAVLGLGPGLDGALGERPRLVRNDQVHVEVDGVAEALAARAGAVGAVEREQARLGLVEAQVAALALEALGEAEVLRLALRRRGLDDDLAGFAV